MLSISNINVNIYIYSLPLFQLVSYLKDKQNVHVSFE